MTGLLTTKIESEDGNTLEECDRQTLEVINIIGSIGNVSFSSMSVKMVIKHHILEHHYLGPVSL